MFGKIELANYEGIVKMPQEAASAWSYVEGLVGASYVPLLYIGSQVVKGVNYYFIAEQTLITNPPIRRVVTMCINSFDGHYEIINVADVI